jgi:hypothetical protein
VYDLTPIALCAAATLAAALILATMAALAQRSRLTPDLLRRE